MFNDDSQASLLKDGEGYLSVVMDANAPLRNIEFIRKENSESFYIGSASKGFTLITIKVPAGEYCLIGFDVYNWDVNYQDGGFCTYVEEGELNYFGEMRVRNPITNLNHDYTRFIKLLRQKNPGLCKEYVDKDCQA